MQSAVGRRQKAETGSRPPASCLLLAARASGLLSSAFCSLLSASCFLSPVLCLLPTADCRLLSASCSLPSTSSLLPPASCLPLSAFCLLPTADCRLPTCSTVAFAIDRLISNGKNFTPTRRASDSSTLAG